MLRTMRVRGLLDCGGEKGRGGGFGVICGKDAAIKEHESALLGEFLCM